MKLAAIIVNFNGGDQVVELVKKLKSFPILDLVIVVDNKSSDKSFTAIKKIDAASRKVMTIASQENKGFAAGVNLGAKLAFSHKVDKIVLINPDLKITNDQLTKLCKSRASVVSPVLSFSRNGKQILDFGGIINWWFGRTTHLEVTNPGRLISPYHLYDRTKVEYVSGACMLISKTAFQKVKGFDERYFLYFEDVDFCLSVKRVGLSIQVNNKIAVSHSLSEHRYTRNDFKITKNIESNYLFIKKWVPFPKVITALIYWHILKFWVVRK